MIEGLQFSIVIPLQLNEFLTGISIIVATCLAARRSSSALLVRHLGRKGISPGVVSQIRQALRQYSVVISIRSSSRDFTILLMNGYSNLS
jgi:hypothetical protein